MLANEAAGRTQIARSLVSISILDKQALMVLHGEQCVVRTHKQSHISYANLSLNEESMPILSCLFVREVQRLIVSGRLATPEHEVSSLVHRKQSPTRKVLKWMKSVDIGVRSFSRIVTNADARLRF